MYGILLISDHDLHLCMIVIIPAWLHPGEQTVQIHRTNKNTCETSSKIFYTK